MNKNLSKVKREVFDLFGEISIEELYSNNLLQNLIKDISKDFEYESIILNYQNEGLRK